MLFLVIRFLGTQLLLCMLGIELLFSLGVRSCCSFDPLSQAPEFQPERELDKRNKEDMAKAALAEQKGLHAKVNRRCFECA